MTLTIVQPKLPRVKFFANKPAADQSKAASAERRFTRPGSFFPAA
jgi:hypothetical protein